MRAREALKVLVGSAAIYAVVAACSAGAGADWTDSAGATGAGGADSGIADAWDAIANPVPDAQAADDSGSVEPPKPDVATVACEQHGGLYYAIKEYPGRSVIDLAGLRVVGKVKPSYAEMAKVPGGYTHGEPGLYLRDGAAIAYCGDTTVNTFTEVTFVLPPY